MLEIRLIFFLTFVSLFFLFIYLGLKLTRNAFNATFSSFDLVYLLKRMVLPLIMKILNEKKKNAKIYSIL